MLGLGIDPLQEGHAIRSSGAADATQKIISEHAVVADGDEWRLDGFADVVCDGGDERVTLTPRSDVQLGPELSARKRTILLARGLIAFAKV